MPSPPRRRYDHQLRNRVARGEPINDIIAVDIPRSTCRSWKRRGPVDVITDPASALAPAADVAALRERVDALSRRLAITYAVLRLLLALIRATGGTLAGRALPEGEAKRTILDAIRKSAPVLGRTAALAVVGLSPTRHHMWLRRELDCRLDDASSCPRRRPQRLTAAERSAMRDMVTSRDYAHLSLRTLGILARRLGRVFASYDLWTRLTALHAWLRPRARIYPPRPRVGVRASRPNELWHVDVTIIRLIDGTKTYIHAVLDNYSRKILAYAVEPKLCAGTTRALLARARQHLREGETPRVMTDAGSENLTLSSDDDGGEIADHVIAQVEVSFSNSMIEAFWRQLKSHCLYLHHLDTLATVTRLVARYVADHNALIPRVELDSRTPDEVHGGLETDIKDRLTAAHAAAVRARLTANANLRCESCRRPERPTRVVP